MTADTKGEWRAVLSKHFLLQHLQPEELDELLTVAFVRRAASGEMLFQKGDPGDSLMAIISGRIKISTLSESGKEVALNILGPGDMFGEIALIDGRERTADASAMAASELLVIQRRDFMPFLEHRPDVSARLLVVLCERIRWVSDLYEDAVFLDLPARLSKQLLRLAKAYGEPVPNGTMISLKLSQQELGNLMGTTRESVNKQIGAWREEGLISIDKGFITIHEMDTLALYTTPI
jgi:CRP-like cAMP-binding protein